MQGGSGQGAPAHSGQPLPVVEVYKSAQCGCCKLWAEHLEKSGFKVILHNVDDIPAARKKLGMPDQYGSCHTARVGQYLVEGHVPAADIKRLLKERPRVDGHGAIGLAVPAMPPGSPGMESDDPVPYDTLLVGKDGNAKVFAHH
ncbi:MAG: metal-binding protein [Gallionellales bacterium RIFCSPLOWO2_02_58_13]|nr:MAG: metal-binding protein [Gallionellales bacterium RIFCSPLOWO2_02_58_13]